MYGRFNGLKILLGFLLTGAIGYAQNKDIKTEAVNASFTFDSKEYNYGTVPENGGKVEHIFTVSNTGTTPLVIKQVVSSCGCTVPEWTRQPVVPQQSGLIKVSFDPKGRIGAIDKSVTVYMDKAEPVELALKGTVVEGDSSTVEKLPVFMPTETAHEFGTIGENDGYAEHIFTFKNVGTAPLVVTRVQASCGCTKPEWTTTPVAPGEEGEIILAYNPRGRLGPFNKYATVYTNEDSGYKRYKLTITGLVVDKPQDPHVNYVDTVGGVGVEQNYLLYKNFTQGQDSKKVAYLKNFNTETVYFSWENVPDYMTVQSPDSLKSDWANEFTVTIDGVKTADKRGRITDNLLLTIKDKAGKVLGKENIAATVNYLDDFKQLSPLESVNAPHLNIENAMIDFGKLKSGFLGMGSVSGKEIMLTNGGKSDLIIHSMTSEDPRVQLPDMQGKTIAAGASLPVKATIKVKDVETSDIDTDIYVVCNDPKGPVRMIKITAQKAK
ncbi:MAG: DUF1573 domain-containing protein [Tannerella sp.]|jgi:hypothetical protein|nr:DUF1573 domain-containing protein [Tannerella sp.]